MHNFTLPENAKCIGVLKPATDAAGRTGRYINAAFAAALYFVFHFDQANAATIEVDVLQASDNAGTGAKAVTGNRRIWANLDLATNDTDVRETDAQTFTTDAALKEKQVILQVNPADLDLAGGFTYVAPRTGASNVANLTACQVYIVPSYAGLNQVSYTA